jgi:predicted Zn finger-like uncharacterized protein
MTTLVTQCPNCRTSFRVTEAQLNIANGAVRCGSCLHIFNAPDHWLDTLSTPRTTQTPPARQPSDQTVEAVRATNTSACTPDNPNTTIEHSVLDSIFDDDIFDDTDLDSLMNDFSPDDEHGKTTASSKPQTLADDYTAKSAFSFNSNLNNDTTARPSVDQFDELDEFDNHLINHSLADHDALINDTYTESTIEGDAESLADDEPGEDTRSSRDNNYEFSDVFLSLDYEEGNAAVFKDLDDIGEDTAAAGEEGWAAKLIEDEEPDAHEKDHPEDDLGQDDPFAEIPQALHQPRNQRANPSDPGLLNSLADIDLPGEQQSAPEDEFILGHEPLMAGERIGHDKLTMLANIEPEPVEIASSRKVNHWQRRAWLASIFVATMLLAGQYIYFNFERIARDNNYRPAVAAACSILGCQLPSLDAIDLIRSSNLMVRSHPSVKDALVVDVIISNLADFKQAFPVMELQFSDLSGNIIAGRRFTPEEYLAGEMLGSQTMPARQPIHISLEIVDPGAQAVNYQLFFHSRRDS